MTKIIGLDVGATNIRGAIVHQGKLSNMLSKKINNQGTEKEVLEDIFQIVENLLKVTLITAIGLGVPGIVDVEKGIVYDVQNIPSWKEVPLKSLLESRFKIPVFINNDANCFAAGEHFFGKGKGISSLVGVTIGTGLGCGLVLNNKLYPGFNCGAGEMGMQPYLDNVLEYYASGSFFSNIHNIDGLIVFNNAKNGDELSLKLYEELGFHLGNAIMMIIYAYDPQMIILGGSVINAYSFFQKGMWNRIRMLAYSRTVERITVEISTLENSGILGAAALYYDDLTQK